MTHDTKAPEVMAPRADASSEPGAGAARPLEASAAMGRSPEPRSPMVAPGGAAAPGASPARSEPAEDAGEAKGPKRNKKRGPKPNNLRRLRIERMMSKAELARRANLSVLTIDRVEKGYGCRMDTKRKILEALGLSLADRVRVFGEEE
jgi:DNA-binding XRE family transcriptional regulator